MTTGQILALLDAAMRSSHPLLFFDAVETLFKSIGRHQDGIATAWMRCLYAQGEIELLTGLRTAWARGDEASSTGATQATAQIRGAANSVDPEGAHEP